jgi:hypothetical protein
MKYLKSYEEKRRGNEIVYTFTTKAKSGEHQYTVHILQDDPKYDETNGHSYNGLALSIDDTPACWYVSTLLHYSDPPIINFDKISISGSYWMCDNWREIGEELKSWVANIYPHYEDLKKYNI